MREHHESKHGGSDRFHGVHEATTKEEVVIQLGIYNLNINQDCLTSKLYGNVLEKALRMRRYTIVRT